MRTLIFLLIAVAATAQVRIPGPGGSVPSGTPTFTSLIGGTSIGSIDNGNNLVAFASQFKTGANWSSISFPSCTFWVDSPDTSVASGCAVYSDSANAPNSLICGAHTNSPASGWNTLTLSGCGTVSASTAYWVSMTTASATQGQELGEGPCMWISPAMATQYGFLSSFTTPTYWPSTFPSITGNNTGNCYAVYVSTSYSSTDHFNVISMAPTQETSGGSACTACTTTIAPLGTGHSLLLSVWSNGTTISSVSDSASDTLAQRTIHTVSGQQIGIYSIDRATAGVSSITVNQTSGFTRGAYIELAGTANPSFDVAASDSAYQATPFTSAATAATANATEYGFGIAINTLGTGTFTGTSGWTDIAESTHGSGPAINQATFFQVFSSTGTKTLTGTHSTAGTNNLTGLATFR